MVGWLALGDLDDYKRSNKLFYFTFGLNQKYQKFKAACIVLLQLTKAFSELAETCDGLYFSATLLHLA